MPLAEMIGKNYFHKEGDANKMTMGILVNEVSIRCTGEGSRDKLPTSQVASQPQKKKVGGRPTKLVVNNTRGGGGGGTFFPLKCPQTFLIFRTGKGGKKQIMQGGNAGVKWPEGSARKAVC